MALSMTKILDGDTLTVALRDRLDTLTSPELDDELSDIISGVKHLVFDMTELTYISSAGLRLLLIYQQKMKVQGKMTIRNVRKEVMSVLKLTGFDKFLKIEQ